MTAAKTTYRRRRGDGASRVPAPIARWFAGEQRVSMTALTYPHRFVLPELWALWLQDHPGATPPENLVVHLNPHRGHAEETAAQVRRQLGLKPITKKQTRRSTKGDQ